MNWYRKAKICIAEVLTINNKWTNFKDLNIPIELNPSLEQAVALAQRSKRVDKSIRMLPTPDGWYMWPAEIAIHLMIIEALGLSMEDVLDWDSDGPEAVIKGDRLLIWLPPELQNSKISFPWSEKLKPYTEDEDLNYYIDLTDDYQQQPQKDEIDQQSESAAEAFNLMDQPTSSFYTDWRA